jgi:hypothetical protein
LVPYARIVALADALFDLRPDHSDSLARVAGRTKGAGFNWSAEDLFVLRDEFEAEASAQIERLGLPPSTES